MKYSILPEQIATTNPLFSSYWFYGDLEVLISQYDKDKAYILNNFLNLYSFGFDSFSLYFSIELKHKQMEIYKHCPFLDYRIIERAKQPITIEFMKKWIDDGWSLIVYTYRNGYQGFENNFCPHQIMIYGYDDEKQIFYFCDNSPIGKYETGLIGSYEAFEKGYSGIDLQARIDTIFEFENHCYALKPQSCPTYDINLYTVTEEIKKYLGMIPNEYAYLQNYDGIYVYHHLLDYLTGVLNNQYEFSNDLASFSVLRDHKTVYSMLLRVLSKRNIVSADFANRFTEIILRKERMMSLALLYRHTHKTVYLQRLIKQISVLKKAEYDYLCELVKMLDAYISRQGYLFFSANCNS